MCHVNLRVSQFILTCWEFYLRNVAIQITIFFKQNQLKSIIKTICFSGCHVLVNLLDFPCFWFKIIWIGEFPNKKGTFANRSSTPVNSEISDVNYLASHNASRCFCDLRSMLLYSSESNHFRRNDLWIKYLVVSTRASSLSALIQPVNPVCFLYLLGIGNISIV